MKKWLKFIFLSFFSHKTAKEGIRRGYTNVFISFVLALLFLWVALIGSEILPFGALYSSAGGFKDTAYAVLANSQADKRIEIRIEDGVLKAKRHGGEYSEALFVNTFENEADRKDYSRDGYNIVVDTRAADTPAEIEAYCISNDGKESVITYEDYLTLSEVARLNFDFKIRYTGNALELTDELVEGYLEYIDGLDGESKGSADSLEKDLSTGKITEGEYRRGIYELYFKSYYPEITAYESSSAVPLLRNYYIHQYVNEGAKNYLFIFDDYMTGTFEAWGGKEVSFNGFYNNLDDGPLSSSYDVQKDAEKSVDRFIKKSFDAVIPVNLYIHAMNTLMLAPFLALMLMVATLLSYSLMRLRGVESVGALGSMLKIVGSFVWFSSAISAVLTVMTSFFVGDRLIIVLPAMLFFIALIARAVVFIIKESKLASSELEQQKAEQTGD